MWDDEEFRNKVIEHLEKVEEYLGSVAESLKRLADRIDRDELVPAGEAKELRKDK